MSTVTDEQAVDRGTPAAAAADVMAARPRWSWLRRDAAASPEPAAVVASTAARAESRVVLTQARMVQKETTDDARRRRELAEVKHERKLRKQRDKERGKQRARVKARRRARWARMRHVIPLLLANACAVGGQLSYGYDEIADKTWPWEARLAVAMVYALASETIALYVGWHAHTALLERQYRAAATLRRWSYGIAAMFAAVNYSHFDGEDFTPTGLACALAVFSLASPWLWGLHSRRQRNIQLIRENPQAIDHEGVEFSRKRRLHFPIRSFKASRYALDVGITRPGEAWRRYNELGARRQPSTTPAAAAAAAAAAAVAVERDGRTLSDLVIIVGALESIAAGMPDRQICALLHISMGRLAMARSAAKIRTLHAQTVTSVRAPGAVAAGPVRPALGAAESVAGEPVAGESVSRSESVAGESVAGEPVAGEPVSRSESVAGESVVGEPVSRDESVVGESVSRDESVVGESVSRRGARVRAASSRGRLVVSASAREPAADESVIRAAFEALGAELGREPSGAELAERAGCSKATANRWKQHHNNREA